MELCSEVKEILLNALHELGDKEKITVCPLPYFSVKETDRDGVFVTDIAEKTADTLKTEINPLAQMICETVYLCGSNFDKAQAINGEIFFYSK